MSEQKWQLDQRTLFILNNEGVNKFNMTVQPGQDDQGARVRYPECEAQAESILLALNAHAGLVEAAKEAIERLDLLTEWMECACGTCKECGKPAGECSGTACAQTCSCSECDSCLAKATSDRLLAALKGQS